MHHQDFDPEIHLTLLPVVNFRVMSCWFTHCKGSNDPTLPLLTGLAPRLHLVVQQPDGPPPAELLLAARPPTPPRPHQHDHPQRGRHRRARVASPGRILGFSIASFKLVLASSLRSLLNSYNLTHPILLFTETLNTVCSWCLEVRIKLHMVHCYYSMQFAILRTKDKPFWAGVYGD